MLEGQIKSISENKGRYNELTRSQIHDLFTMVLQDTWLFEGSIYENLVFNMQGITKDQVRGICKSLGLDHFINTLPKGYESMMI